VKKTFLHKNEPFTVCLPSYVQDNIMIHVQRFQDPLWLMDTR